MPAGVNRSVWFVNRIREGVSVVEGGWGNMPGRACPGLDPGARHDIPFKCGRLPKI